MALISALIMAAILLVTILTTSTAGFYVRMDVLESEEARSAEVNAESCLEIGFLELATSSDPTAFSLSNQKVLLGAQTGQSCTIVSVTHTKTSVTFSSRAQVAGAFALATATVTLPPTISVLSWSESP